MTNYKSIQGQSIYDVCMQTYGTLDRLIKLLTDNNIVGTEAPIPIGQLFTFDETLIFDIRTYNNNFKNKIFYCTALSEGASFDDSFDDGFDI